MIQSEVTYREMNRSRHVEEAVERARDRLERLLPHVVKSEIATLRTMVQRCSRGIFEVSVSLRLPRRSFYVHEEGHDVDGLVNEVLNELLQRARKFKSRRAERTGVAVDQELRSENTESNVGRRTSHDTGELWIDSQDRSEINQLIEDAIGRLKEFIERRLIHHGLILERLGEGRAMAILDEAVATALETLPAKPVHLPVRAWLYKKASDACDAWVARTADASADSVSVDERATFASIIERMQDAGTEMLDFWQPDEEPHAEDVLGDPNSTNPEELVGGLELERLLMSKLEHLPELERDVVVLAMLEDLPIDEIAELRGLTPDEVTGLLSRAKDQLRTYFREVTA
ncbi:MAG: hypothetical protein HYV63_13430 [Candidatus Schekmanbacteria bacterium]|nr:hypothetical protein [Candidatus Schekmanbacteria bacterium]